MPQLEQVSTCPSCAEPFEESDRFCGVCGTALTSLRAGEEAATSERSDNDTVVLPPHPYQRPPATQQPSSSPRGADEEQFAEGPQPAAGTPKLPDFSLAPPAPASPAGPPPTAHGQPPLPPTALAPPHAPSTTPPTPATPPPGHLPSYAPAPHVSAPHASASYGAADHPAPAPGALPPPDVSTDPRTDPRTGLSVPPASEQPAARAQPVSPAPPPAPAAPAAPGGSAKKCAACGHPGIDEDGYCEKCGHSQPRERDHMEERLDGVAVVSDRGYRHHRNEDFFSVTHTVIPSGADAVVAVVCDGVSSSTQPDEASAAAARTACASLRDDLPAGTHPQQAMQDALLRAGEAVSSLAGADRNPEQNSPACTLVSSVIAENILTVGWVGDSRAYWIPDDRDAAPSRLTEDDSWAAQMVAAGLMEEGEAYADPRAHAITGWLGADSYELEPHTASFSPTEAGVVLVCTDGLWNYAEAARDMAGVVPADARTAMLSAARQLVDFALRSGGHDNVTVAVLPFPSPSRRAGSA